MLSNIILHSNFLLWVCMALLSLVSGQIEYDPINNSLICSRINGSYCLSGSLGGPAMMSCVSSTLAEVRSCNIELSSILPKEYHESAVCYESTPESGNAICAFNGTGYALNGSTTSVPETVLCNFANSSVTQDEGQTARTFKRSEENGLKSFTTTVTGLVTRLLTTGPRSIGPVESRTDKQEPVYCSNPWSGRYFTLSQSTSTDAATVGSTRPQPMPTSKTLQVPPLQCLASSSSVTSTSERSTSTFCLSTTTATNKSATTLFPTTSTKAIASARATRTTPSNGAAPVRSVNISGLLLVGVLLPIVVELDI